MTNLAKLLFAASCLLPAIVITPEMSEPIKQSLPILPNAWRQSLRQHGLDASQTEVLLEAEVDRDGISYLDLLKDADQATFKPLANLMVNVEIPLRRDQPELSVQSSDQRQKIYTEIMALSKSGEISSTNAKALLSQLLSKKDTPSNIAELAQEQGLIMKSDEDEIQKIVEQVLKANPGAAADVKNGEMKAIGFLVGQVMKQSKGQANPQMAQKLIKSLLQ